MGFIGRLLGQPIELRGHGERLYQKTPETVEPGDGNRPPALQGLPSLPLTSVSSFLSHFGFFSCSGFFGGMACCISQADLEHTLVLLPRLLLIEHEPPHPAAHLN